MLGAVLANYKRRYLSSRGLYSNKKIVVIILKGITR